MQDIQLKRHFLLSTVWSLGLSALIAIFIFLVGDFGDLELRVLLTTLSVGGYSLTGLCCASLYEQGRSLNLAFAGMLFSVVGFFLALLVVWELVDRPSDLYWRVFAIVSVLAFSAAHLSLISFIKPDVVLVQRFLSFTRIFIGVVTLMLIYLIMIEFDFEGDFYFRLLAVFAILDVFGTVATPILHKVYKK